MSALPNGFDVFQAVAEAELEKDLERTFKIFFYKNSEKVSQLTTCIFRSVEMETDHMLNLVPSGGTS